MSGFALGLAFILDLWLGDPPSWPHPVIWIGRMIDGLDRTARRWFRSPAALRLAGVVLVVMVVGITWGAVRLALSAAGRLDPILETLVGLYVAYACLAVRGLHDQTWRVAEALRAGDLPRARVLLSLVVGRRTRDLDRQGALRAVVETVAENLSDGVVAPLFFLALGGPAWGLAYKAVNTLDSMIGYKNEKYRDLGWAAARLDDVVNYFPARISAALICLAAWILGLDAGGAAAGWRRDGGRHSSPNAGRPEAAVAGALGIRLGGPNVYGDKLVEKPYIGPAGRPLNLADVFHVEEILLVSGGLMLAASALVRGWWS